VVGKLGLALRLYVDGVVLTVDDAAITLLITVVQSDTAEYR
jgi:hypothetical protein